MAIVPNYPQLLLDEHHHWHDPDAHPGAPGRRQNQPGTSGAGLEFLQFHRDYVQRFRAWYDVQPFAEPTLVEAWPSIPNSFKNANLTNWNAALAEQERRILTNSPRFRNADELGNYIEFGLHGWLHNAAASVFNEPILRAFHSPQSTYFYQLHGLVDKWWRDYVAGQTPTQSPVTLAINASATSGNISRAGEQDLYNFQVTSVGRYTIETYGVTDVIISLYGPNNLATYITEDDDSGEGSNSRISLNLSAGTYYIRVRHYNNSGVGTYQITVRSEVIAIPEIPVNGVAIQGSISAPNESDLYTFYVTTGGFYTVETQGSSDTIIALFGPNSQTTLIAEDDDSGVGSNARLVINLSAGQYFVRVRLYSRTATGAYSLLVRS